MAEQQQQQQQNQSGGASIILQEINELNKRLFQKQDIINYFNKEQNVNKIELIVDELLVLSSNYKLEKDAQTIIYFIEILCKHSELYTNFLFHQSESYKEKLIKIISHNNLNIRQLVPLALVNNSQHIFETLQKQINKNEEMFKDYVNVLFYQLSDPETEIGIKILKVLAQFSKFSQQQQQQANQSPFFFSHQLVLNELKKGIKHQNTVVVVRFMDLIIQSSNNNQDIQKIYIENNLLEDALSIYSTKDILLKLSCVEIISKMGESTWNAQYFCKHNLLQQIIQEAFDQNEDFYMRKYQILLISKMANKDVIKIDYGQKQKLLKFIEQCLYSNSNEEIEGGLELVGQLCYDQSGLNLFIGNKQLLIKFFSFSSSTKDVLKRKFLNAFANVLETKNSQQQSSPKKQVILQGLFKCFGQLDYCSQMSQNYQGNTDDYGGSGQDNDTEAINKLFQLLVSPFPDIEIEALYVLSILVQYKFGIKEICKNSGSIEYLIQSYSKNKEIFDLKKDIINYLKQNLKLAEVNDPIIQEFHKNFDYAIELQGNHEQSTMFYDTEFQ